MKFILFFFIVYSFFFFLARKYQNPYKLYYLLGRKGAGKSSFMAREMIRYLKKGWNVYTDMPGVSIPGVRFFNTSDLANFVPPPKSAVFLDEVGLSMDSRGFKSFPAGLRDYFALQRHYKNTVYVNSQSFDVDKKVRDRCDCFLYLQKIFVVFTLIRPVYQIVSANDDPKCDCPVRFTYQFGKIFSWRFLFLPKYAGLFDSFYTPERDTISFIDTSAEAFEEWLAECRFRNKIKKKLKNKFTKGG